MLNIILGQKDEDKYLSNNKFVDYNDGVFDTEYTEDWFNDKFIRRALHDIDHIDIEQSSGKALKNSITGDVHAPEGLSTGCKTVILIYKFPDVIFQARFGDNCTDFVEEIASKNDITIKSDYLHCFNFKYIKEINYINYNKTITSRIGLLDLLGDFRNDSLDDYVYNDDDTNTTHNDDMITIKIYNKFNDSCVATLNVTDKITVIIGDSATGKTDICRMLEDRAGNPYKYEALDNKSRSIALYCCTNLEMFSKIALDTSLDNSIVIIDEYVATELNKINNSKLRGEMEKQGKYFIIFQRDSVEKYHLEIGSILKIIHKDMQYQFERALDSN